MSQYQVGGHISTASGWAAEQLYGIRLWKKHFNAVGRGQLALPEHRKQIFLVSPARERRCSGALHLTQHHKHHQCPRPITPGCFPSTVLSPGQEGDMEPCLLPSQGDLLLLPVPAAPAITEGAAPTAAPADNGLGGESADGSQSSPSVL